MVDFRRPSHIYIYIYMKHLNKKRATSELLENNMLYCTQHDALISPQIGMHIRMYKYHTHVYHIPMYKYHTHVYHIPVVTHRSYSKD